MISVELGYLMGNIIFMVNVFCTFYYGKEDANTLFSRRMENSALIAAFSTMGS